MTSGRASHECGTEGYWPSGELLNTLNVSLASNDDDAP